MITVYVLIIFYPKLIKLYRLCPEDVAQLKTPTPHKNLLYLGLKFEDITWCSVIEMGTLFSFKHLELISHHLSNQS